MDAWRHSIKRKRLVRFVLPCAGDDVFDNVKEAGTNLPGLLGKRATVAIQDTESAITFLLETPRTLRRP